MFEYILVPLDGSTLAECVLPHAIAIARANNSQVRLLRVLDPISAATRPRPVDPLDWQIRKAEAEAYLKEIAVRLEKASLQSDVIVLEGKAAENVVTYAHENNISLIILSSHGQSGISGWNVSSVVQKIILRAKTSVMIVRAYQPLPEDFSELHYQHILLPMDGSQRAEIVFPLAGALARVHGAQILAAHVVREPEMPRRTHQTQEDIELVNRIMERNRAEASKYLAEIGSHLDVPVDTRLLIGESVTKALHELVDQSAIDLVLLSAHGYSGDVKWPYGNVVISFIAYGTTPLLVVQDLPPDRLEPTRAEIMAREQGSR